MQQSSRKSLIAQLKRKHGHILGPTVLAELLEFKSFDSCTRALRLGSLNLPAFRLPGRPGYFVYTEDYADWLLAARASAVPDNLEKPASRLEEVADQE